MKLSTKGRYAVMAMADLAGNSTSHPVTLSEIALRQGLPVQYLEQLFLKLRRQGLIKSTRGQAGGYVLAQHAKNIKISTIMAAVDEPIQVTRCTPNSEYGCQGRPEQCVTHNLWEGLALHILAYLNQISLEDLSNQPVRKCGKLKPMRGKSL
ncbi:MAG: Rrf2 family transcriptional regulator [Alphaproteobacteria bacterium]|nr:Rrf2 family transcriptional regulator [Alphaproteobacteria bacterium]